jgi:arylsulfatase
MKQLGLLDVKNNLPPRSKIDSVEVAKRMGSMTKDGMNPAWKSLQKERRTDLARRMAVYAAMVENMDANIGRVVEELRNSGELDNTLILFLSDNGACAEWEPFGFDLKPKNRVTAKAGYGINNYTPGSPNILHSGKSLENMGGIDSLFSYGSGWANACNTPLSLYKHYANEGGIRSPLIAHWPAGITSKNEIRPHVTHVMDIMATFVELSKAEYPKHYKGNEILPIEGRSLTAAFRGQKDTHITLLFEHERNIALRQGDWKLLANSGISKTGFRENAKWRLYNVLEDPSEQHDLSSKKPLLLKKLKDVALREAQRTFVLPAP